MLANTNTSFSSTNRLVREKSPYLLQHAHNPVEWYPWGAEAFNRAQAENKPIFLSIGYSTCHWCHVMERESFEDRLVAAFLNKQFVSIKVDREERPDVDKIYMTFVQSTTGSGGWPLSVFLTPDLKPFFGGTYFPPDAGHGRPGFLQLLRQISQLWQERHADIIHSASDIQQRLEAATAGGRAAANLRLTAEFLQHAGSVFKESYDPVHGGFGAAPKFPQPSIPSFLLHYSTRFHDNEAAGMVVKTCDAMAAGGIHDQLGGGFARYAVDAGWLVPHFEKMLYDNAQLAQLYLDTHLVSGEAGHSRIARGILDYVLRDMTHAEGGFYSAEDADSEGHEGKFYCWTWAELSLLLTPEEFNVAAKYFGITPGGNFLDHSHPQPLAGLNVLSVVDPDLRVGDLPQLAAAREKMLTARSRRIRPHRDDKILTSWNGLMLGAFARASVILNDDTYRAAAEKNLAFIHTKLWVGGRNGDSASTLPLTPALFPGEREKRSPPPGESTTTNSSTILQQTENEQRLSSLAGGEGRGKVNVGTLFHRWRDGEHDQVQLLEDYAGLLAGVLDLYEATLIPRHLELAIELAEAMIARFYDPATGGFWQSAADTQHLILRVKDDYDGAEPSGNSVATFALMKLAAITGRAEFKGPAEATLQLYAQRLKAQPAAMAFMLQAVDFQLQSPLRIVIAGDPDAEQFKALLRAAHAVYRPDKVVLGNLGAVEEFARTLPFRDGAVAYVCTGTACQPPTADPARLKALLEGSG